MNRRNNNNLSVGAADTGREARLLRAINAAAATLQRSARSEEDVLQAFSEQIIQLNLVGMISLLDKSGDHLVTQVAAYSSDALRRLEKASGITARGFQFAVADVEVCQRVLETGEPAFVSSVSRTISQILPQGAHTFLNTLQKSFGKQAAIFAPMKLENNIQGLLSVTSADLDPRDVPAIEALANHIAIAIDNARLLERERQRRQESETLRQATAALTSTLDLQAVLDILLNRLAEVIPHDSASVFLLEEDNLRGVAARGLPDPEAFIGQVFSLDRDALFHEIFITSHSLIIEDAQADSRFNSFAGTTYVRGWMGIPLIVQDEVIGILTCDSRQVNLYTTANAHLAEVFANQAAIAVENARLLERERHRRRESESLQLATAALTSSLNLQDVLDSLLSRLAKVIQYDSAAVFLLEEEHLVGMASRGIPGPETFEGQVFTDEDDILFREIRRTGQSLILEDAQSDPRFQGFVGTDYVRGWMGIPLIVQDEVIGYLTCDSRQAAAYKSSHAKLAATFANQAAIAIVNARLFEGESAARQQAETLRELAKAVGSSLELNATLRLILEQLKRVLVFDTSAVLLIGEKSVPDLVVGIGYENERDTSQAAGELLSVNPILRRMSENLEPIIIPDVTQYPDWIWVPGAEHVRSFLGVPIISYRGEHKMIGIVMVDRAHSNYFNQQHLNDVQALAQHIAIAIENARLFEAERAQLLIARTLQEVGALLTSQLSLDEVLEKLLDLLGRVVEYDSASIQLLDSQNHLQMAAGRGFPDMEQARQSVRKYSQEIIRPDWAERGVIVVPDTSADRDWFLIPETEYIQSWVGAALLVKGRFIGHLSIDSRQAHAYDETMAETVMAFANQAAIAIENARLFEVERQRIAELEAVRQASLSLTASLELPQVLDSITSSVLKLLPECNNSHIFLYDTENQRLTFGSAMWAEGRQGLPFIAPRPQGLTYTVALTGDMVVVPNMKDHPIYENAPADWSGAIAGLPLKIGERVVGVMNVSFRHPRPIPDAELRLLALLGDQAAIAIENARLFAQAATERRHLGLLYDISQEMVSSLDSDDILQNVLTLTCEALQGLASSAYLYLHEEDRLSLRALYGYRDIPLSEADAFIDLRPGKGLAGWVAEHREAVYVADVSEDDRWYQVPGFDDGVVSVLCAPILAEDQLLGVISVSHSDEDAFSAEHLALVQAICQEVGLALSNARRYQQVQRRLAEISLIQALAQTFNQRLEVQTLLSEVVTQLAHMLQYPCIRIFLVEDEQLILKGFHGPAPNQEVYPLSFGLMGQAVLSGQLTSTPVEASLSGGLSELAVPIYRGESVVGVIEIQSELSDPLTRQDRDLLQVLSDQISVALENAVLYEQVRSHADNLERTVVQRTSELTELYRLSQEISYQLSYTDLLRLLLRHLRNAIGCEIVMGCLGVGDRYSILIEADRPLDPGVQAKIRARWEQALTEASNSPIDADQLHFDITPANDFSEDGISIRQLASLVQVPVLADQQPVGMLMVGSEVENAFGSAQVRLLNTFANQAAATAQRLETLLTAQQRQLESLVEHLPIGVLLLDDEFQTLVANPMGRELLDKLNPEETGRALQHLGPFTLQEVTERRDDRLPIEITLEGPPRRIFAVQIRPADDATAGQSQQWVLTVSDITQERENITRIQIQERLATVGQLAAGIAHDFNNIMATILVYTDLMRYDTEIPPASREKLETIQQQVERAASLIRQILDFSRKSVIEQSALDLLPFVKELDKMLARVLPETISLKLSHPPGAYWLNGDPTRLQQAFMNLALNARDAMPDGGELRFELSHYENQPGESTILPEMPPGKWVRITVSDTGYGIPPEVRKHIFEPFFTTKPVGRGTGLGLAQVYGIVKQHGGFIDVQSQVGQGASFIIYLPALDIDQGSKRKPESIEPYDGRGQTVMVVEDDRTTRQALQALLESNDYQVLMASTGVEALKNFEAAEENIVLVVSDVVMPEMGGVALYAALQERDPDIKMLLITGHPLEEANQALLETGSVHWLQKPFSVADINQALRVLLTEPLEH